MPRRALTPAEQQARAIQAARKMIAQGDRPGYNIIVRKADVGVTWVVLGWPEMTGHAASRRDIDSVARTVLATVLEVPPDRFDVHVEIGHE